MTLMTAAKSVLTGHTLTVERILDVPELEGTRLREEAETNTFSGPVWVFVERRDGEFVCDHGTNDRRDLNPSNHMWDNARFLAERLSWRVGEHTGPRELISADESSSTSLNARLTPYWTASSLSVSRGSTSTTRNFCEP